MFTGIIETTGRIKNFGSRGNYRLLTIRPANAFEKIELGESIAVDGCCLTVTAFDAESFTVEASQESQAHTIIEKYSVGTRVNLERAMLPTSRLGGHFVTGHIDGIGKIVESRAVGESQVIGIEYDMRFAPYLAAKGSIAINGISLTVNEIEDNKFRINIIPHTFKNTTVEEWKTGEKINLEFDIIGKYIVRQLSAKTKQDITIEKLMEAGW